MRAILLFAVAITVAGCSSLTSTERQGSWRATEGVAELLATADAPDAPDSAFNTWLLTRDVGSWNPASLRELVANARMPDGRIAFRTSARPQVVPGRKGRYVVSVTFDGRDARPVEFWLALDGDDCQLIVFESPASR